MGCSDECPFRDHYETALKAWGAEIALRQAVEAELAAWRETFEQQTNEGASQRSYRECYAIGTRKLIRTTDARKDP